MLEATDLDNRTLVKESHSICSQVQLRQYGLFLEKNNQKLNSVENIFRNEQLHTNVVTDTVSIQCNSSENITILELVESDNKQLTKIVASFAAICEETDAIILENSNNYYQKLLFYGRVNGNNNIGLQPLYDDLLLILQKLNCAVKRCQQIVNLIIQQLAFMSRKETGLLSNASRLYFQEPIEKLGDLLIHLMTLDCLLHTPSLINQWKIYKRAYRAVHHSNKQFNFPLEQLHSLDKLFVQIESSLLSDNIFQNTIGSVDEQYTSVGKNSTLCDEFNTFLWSALNDLEKTDSETPVDNRKWLRANVLFVFSFHILGNSDKKYFKHLIDINKKISACTLVGNLLWYPEQFLVRHVPALVQSVNERLVQSLTVHRQNLLAQKAQNILRDTVQLCQSACVWMIQLEKIVKEGMSHLKLEHLHQRCTFFLQGIYLVERIEETLKWITNLHAAEAKPMNRTVLLSIFRLTELLKGLLLVFKTHSISITYCVTLVIQYLLYEILVTIRNIKKRLIQDKSHRDRNANALSALQIAEQALNGPSSEKRLLVAKIALSTIYSLADSLIAQVRKKMTQVEMLHSIHKTFSQYCDTSFLYWHKVLLNVYFNSVFDSKNDLPRIAYTFYGLTDCSCILKKEDMDGLQINVKQTFDDKLIIPLCQMVEESLRLHMHSHLQLENGTCFEQGVPEFRSLLNLQPVKFVDNFISIKNNVEHYLSTTFYNLATVVLHDWHTYGEMRRLAYYKHNLDTIEDYLPNQTLEQGLDVLEIMRNIHIFVSKYLYNLNNQIFVEQWSNNKHLNTINIRHIANSIRIHGTGIMNTTVNFTYQFLRKKFYVFSQFMYDEHIKSRLIKDARYFRENKTELDQMYPYDRADKFNRLIRKLGITPTGQSYLDLFRSLISHIGNAMGYIRMIRSGGRHCCSDATCFLPDLDNIADLEPFCEDQQMSKRTTEAAQRLQKDIQTLAGNFIERTEYFKLLVEVFAPVFRNPANMHLRNFYMIVPPLTINFVEHSLACKDRLNKKNKVGAAFTDDGFAMGLAYIIQLLEQGGDLNSLHWFQSIRQKYARDRRNLASQRERLNKDDSKLQQTLTLTEKRIQKYQQEFDLLYYSLSSARIFFR